MEPADDPATVNRSTHRPLPLLPRGGTQPRTTAPAEIGPRRPSHPRPFEDARQLAGMPSQPRNAPPGTGAAFSGRLEDCRHE